MHARERNGSCVITFCLLVHGIPARPRAAAGVCDNSHVSVSSASLVVGRARAHNLIRGIGGTSRSSIELILGHILQPSSPPATGAVCLDNTSDVNRSQGVLSNLESHSFGLPIIGGAGSLLLR